MKDTETTAPATTPSANLGLDKLLEELDSTPDREPEPAPKVKPMAVVLDFAAFKARKGLS